ncbi:MAG: zinc-ribbon domain-containing protein [Acidobacteria bacterium]|nr:zinc-ribbon domain-containing protein [Acidobacteriota bacterium]
MPFCSNCGSEVQPNDQFCGKCGAPQLPSTTPPKPATGANDPFSSIDSNIVAVLCYVPFLGSIASIYVLSAERFRKDNIVRFHAFQGLYLFVAWLIYDWVVEGIIDSFVNRTWVFTRAIRMGLTVTWIFLMYKTSQREVFRVPVIGDLADQSVAEQR